MKRSPALQALSREHHTALVLSKACAGAAASKDAEKIAAQCAKVKRVFEQELEPHFKLEEEQLLPRMQAAGELALVERTLQENRDLRAMATSIALRGNAEALTAFAELLASHVRFEERELFATAERLLPLLGHDFPGD